VKRYLDLLIGTICILYYLYLELVYNGMAFDKFFMVVGCGLVIYHFIKNRMNLNGSLKKILKIFVTIGLSIFLIVESILVFFPKHNIKDDCDYLVVLGASVKKNKPSLTLKGRLDTAIKYLKKSKDDCYIVVSGGKGKDENISEAKAMKNYLVENGVPKNKIILEDESTSTYENFKYSKEKIEQNSNKSIKDVKIKVVTTDFHSFRSFLLAKKNGYHNISFYTSNSLNQFIPVYYAREFFALIKTITIDIALNI
jgi:uncharacterized SAM-binding protein YcdF (DUF218 family)